MKILLQCLLALSSVILVETGMDNPKSMAQDAGLLPLEKIEGEVWVSPNLDSLARTTRRVILKVWFEDQFLGTGDSYLARSREFAGMGRRALRKKVIDTLRQASRKTFEGLEESLNQLVDQGVVSDVQPHWIVNGMTCVTTVDQVERVKNLKGVSRVFVLPFQGTRRAVPMPDKDAGSDLSAVKPEPFVVGKFRIPWYVRSLLADRVWEEFGVTGEGTLNVIHDFNFVFPANLQASLYRNPGEVPHNGKDDDGNGWIDDVSGFNFPMNSPRLTVARGNTPQTLHGTTCANIVCGTGTPGTPFQFGIAPRSKWAGVIAGADLESAVEWAILQGADTYSMSFSIPDLGETRSHWRKVVEHGSYCGVYFVSGAGNFAQTAKVPVQMRIPEDIPNVVFAAAGVQRDLSRTPFSSQGPVEWNTEHYRDGIIQKPEVCAFNSGLPLLMPDGTIQEVAANGNSFAGPMFCGAIALMLSADPDLLPWDLKEIITTTALDVGPPGVDYETGYGLINCYRAVREVKRRRAIREGKDPGPFTGRVQGDELDREVLQKKLAEKRVVVFRVNPAGNAAKAGIQTGDTICKVQGQKVTSGPQVLQLIRRCESEEILIEVERGEQTLQFRVSKSNPGFRMNQLFQAPVFE